jgi:hypothetical protein
MFLKYRILLVLNLSLFFTAQLFAQEKESDAVKDSNVSDSLTVSLQNPSENVWKPCVSPFVELMGKGFLSLNVDFKKWESHAISAGFLIEGLTPNIMYYYLAGKRHRFEIGGGLSIGFTNELNLGAAMIHGVIGYRYQKKKGLFFRAGFTPFYVMMFTDNKRSKKFFPFAGISLGYSF